MRIITLTWSSLGAASGGGWWPAHGELGLFPALVPPGCACIDATGVLAGEALLETWTARALAAT